MAVPSAPSAVTFRKGAPGAHAYFDRLAALPQTIKAIAFRSNAEIQSFPEAARPSTVRQSIVYDPAMDAAVMRFLPATSIDIKGRFLPLIVTPSDTSFTCIWDFRFDEGFRYLKEGHVRIHKTWRINPGPWIAFKTEYQESAGDGEFAELRVNVPSGRFVIPPDSTRLGEWLRPIVGRFYFAPDEWVRCWFHADEWNKARVLVSAWAASESRPVTQLVDRVPLLPPFHRTTLERLPLTDFFVEYDTSADVVPLPEKWIHSWNRNFVFLRGLTHRDLLPLLQPPGRA